ncbi:IDEAL domain-containing protein [Halalkalibacter akibai]|uniref:IDEAL domain-containing protein n=1 Tax=Halalkalibacter akibai (strain ATCC 43226 / DSM 21942 / CIP 109018 / JCM 9157 / 1139) TaxID=1236973 RepID=W4QZL9_HALA3|nr:IDEAL domain-containing protein [Halalkalibacter akibai]GAE37352.1 hypothetical protein JCM9157_4626 [Halalkalibacter akibai JCM 9157]
MINEFSMNPSVTRQLKVIKSLQSRSEGTVQSLYAQAVLEYSLYYFKKEFLYQQIDEVLLNRNEERFNELVVEYNQLIESHRDGKTVSEDGFELHLHFD